MRYSKLFVAAFITPEQQVTYESYRQTLNRKTLNRKTLNRKTLNRKTLKDNLAGM